MTEGEKGLEGIKPWLENIEVRTVCVCCVGVCVCVCACICVGGCACV